MAAFCTETGWRGALAYQWRFGVVWQSLGKTAIALTELLDGITEGACPGETLDRINGIDGMKACGGDGPAGLLSRRLEFAAGLGTVRAT